MRKNAKRWLNGLAFAGGTLGALILLGRKKTVSERESFESLERDRSADRWARPGMSVTFRAELMPSREGAERTFRVTKLLPSGRVLLEGVAGEHTEQEFEPVR